MKQKGHCCNFFQRIILQRTLTEIDLYIRNMLVAWFITNFHTMMFPIGSMGKNVNVMLEYLFARWQLSFFDFQQLLSSSRWLIFFITFNHYTLFGCGRKLNGLLNGVKKVCSAIHLWIWKHAKQVFQNILHFPYTGGPRNMFVIIYDIAWIHKVIFFLSLWSFRCSEKFIIFEILVTHLTLWFF